MAIGSKVKRLRVTVSVKKICLVSKFPNHCILKLFQKFKENIYKIFSLKIDCYIDYFPDIYLKFLITQLFLKIFPKYRKNFLKIACFRSFLTVPLNFLRILEYIQISSKFSNPFFLKLFLMLGKILPHIFTELCIPKFAWSLLLKILNTYFHKLFPYAAPLLHHCIVAPPPPSSHLLRK